MGIAKQPNPTRLLINQVLKAFQLRTLLKRHATQKDQKLKSVKLAICFFGIIKKYKIKIKKKQQHNIFIKLGQVIKYDRASDQLSHSHFCKTAGDLPHYRVAKDHTYA